MLPRGSSRFNVAHQQVNAISAGHERHGFLISRLMRLSVSQLCGRRSRRHGIFKESYSTTGYAGNAAGDIQTPRLNATYIAEYEIQIIGLDGESNYYPLVHLFAVTDLIRL